MFSYPCAVHVRPIITSLSPDVRACVARPECFDSRRARSVIDLSEWGAQRLHVRKLPGEEDGKVAGRRRCRAAERIAFLTRKHARGRGSEISPWTGRTRPPGLVADAVPLCRALPAVLPVLERRGSTSNEQKGGGVFEKAWATWLLAPRLLAVYPASSVCDRAVARSMDRPGQASSIS
jgi:hypothetical protein